MRCAILPCHGWQGDCLSAIRAGHLEMYRCYKWLIINMQWIEILNAACYGQRRMKAGHGKKCKRLPPKNPYNKEKGTASNAADPRCTGTGGMFYGRRQTRDRRGVRSRSLPPFACEPLDADSVNGNLVESAGDVGLALLAESRGVFFNERGKGCALGVSVQLPRLAEGDGTAV